MLNVAAIVGRLAADPELRHTASGVAVTSFTLAVSRNYSRQGEERQTDWIDVVAWRNTAEFVCKYFTKGQMMAVTGSIQTRSYEDRSGNKRKAVEIQANDVSFVGSKRDNAGGDDSGAKLWPELRPAQRARAPAAGRVQRACPRLFQREQRGFRRNPGGRRPALLDGSAAPR